MEPNYEAPPARPLRPEMPRAIKMLWMTGGILIVFAGLLFLFFVIRYGMSMNQTIKDLGGNQ